MAANGWANRENLRRAEIIKRESKMVEWKDVVGFEGLYRVSSDGRVEGLDRVIKRIDGRAYTVKGRKMTIRKNDDGYSIVKLSKNDNSRYYTIHRLVALAFLPNPQGLDEVNHIDYDRTNNNICNLEWISHGDNVRYSIKGGRHFCTRDLTGKNNPNYGNDTLRKYYAANPEATAACGLPGGRNPKSVPVRLFDCNKTHIRDFQYMGECAEHLIDVGATDASVKSISQYISRNAKTGKPYKGYYFEII